MQNLKKAALAMCLVACMGFGFTNSASAEEAMPSSGVAYEDLDREISNLEISYAHDKKSWASVTDLSLLYYDRGDYKNCYKMSKRALKLYEDGYAYENDEDILREALVKGAAAAYNLGEYRDSEKLLKQLISLNLRGSDDNAKTYNGWAYYYLSNIERMRGNYDRSHFYGGIAINYCPHIDIFVDYWGCFYRTGAFWHWRHHHHHDYRPPMPPPRPHWRHHHRHHHDVHKPIPAPHNRSSVERSRNVEPRRDHAPINQTRHDVKRPNPQRHTVHQQSRPVAQNPRPRVQRPQEHKPAVHEQSRPVAQNSRPQIHHPQGQRPAVHQPRPQTQNPRPQVQRPQGQRPVYQPRPSVQQPQGQRPVYQPRQDVGRPVFQRQAPRPHQAPQGNHRRR